MWFSYFAHEGSRPGENGRDGHYALRDVSVKIAAGEKLAIVGRTGSGKSTMVKLLTRLVEPTAGRVTLDGRDLRDLPLGALRKTIGMVPQEPTLFSDTMARNITFGRADASFDEITRAASVAGLESDIAVLPHGLATIVGERGMSLSGGQKQRVTIARVLIYDPAVVVIDDDFPASIPKPNVACSTAWTRACAAGRRRGVPSRVTVRDADHIVVLEDGEIASRNPRTVDGPAWNLRRAVPSPTGGGGTRAVLNRATG